ncbi:MAG: hypothetical protein R2731_10285 [Nocardioides sp.]
MSFQIGVKPWRMPLAISTATREADDRGKRVGSLGRRRWSGHQSTRSAGGSHRSIEEVLDADALVEWMAARWSFLAYPERRELVDVADLGEAAGVRGGHHDVRRRHRIGEAILPVTAASCLVAVVARRPAARLTMTRIETRLS